MLWGVSKVDVTDSTVSFTPTGKGQPILLTEGKGLDVTTDGIAAQREVDASVNKLVNEVNNLQSKLSSSISLSILKSAVNKAQGLSPNSLPPKPKPSTSSTEDKTRDDDMVYAPFNQDLRFAYLRQWQINQRSIHGGETSSLTQAVSISYGYDPETGEIIIYFHDKYGRVIGIRRISIHDHDYLLLLEALSPWITDNDKKLEALTLSIFMEQLALGYSYEEGINDAIQSALRFARIFLTKVTLSDSLPAENVWKASDLVNEFSENPYAYEFGLLLAKYGALGSSESHQGVDSMETIGNRILTLLGGRKKLKDSKHLLSILDDGGKPGEVFNEGDEQNEVTLDGELLGTRSANLSSETADDLNVDVDRVTGVVGSEITIVNGAKLDPSEIEERDTNQIFAISAAQDVIIEGDVTFENHHNSEQAVVIGAANGIHVRSKSASAFFDAEFVSKYLGEDDPIFLSEEEQIKPKKSPESVHINNHGADLGLGAYDKLELIDVDISTEGHLAVGSLDELKILSTRFDEEVEFSDQNLESVLSLNKFSAGDENEKGNVYLYAHNRIAVNGLGFDEHVREIYMDAITVDLKNVKFPDSSRVILKSRNGYPTFGEKDRKVGHVNFIKNVYHGKDAVNASFFSNDASSRISNKRVDSGNTPAIRIQPHSN